METASAFPTTAMELTPIRDFVTDAVEKTTVSNRDNASSLRAALDNSTSTLLDSAPM
jgi:hypothetical protein